MGVQAMKAATAAHDRRGEFTLLTVMVSDAMGIDTIGQIMQCLYGGNLSVTEIAALSHLVVNAAQLNDEVANTIITKDMDEVARCVKAVALHLGLQDDDTKLILMGGILQAGSIVKLPLQSAILRHLPHCRIVNPVFFPATGAAILARQLQHRVIEPSFINNIKTSVIRRG